MSLDLSAYRPPPHPKGVRLSGDHVILVPLDAKAHGPALFAASDSQAGRANWRYLPYGPFADVPSYGDWLSSIENQNDPVFFTIIRRYDNCPVGVASYLSIHPEDGTIEVGHIHFSPLLQRTTAATEALFLMMQWAFESGYRRYEWKCNAQNAPSRQAAIRLGLSYEGVFRQATISKGLNRDTAWFAAIDKDWPHLKQAFLQYLSDDNFDRDGAPLTSLSTLTSPLLFKTDDNTLLRG